MTGPLSDLGRASLAPSASADDARTARATRGD